MRRVAKRSMKEIKEYLELDYLPDWVDVEDLREYGKENTIETLNVEWSDGNEIHQLECNQNLDILLNLVYEDEEN